MKPLTTPKAIIISGIVIALSTVLSSFITSHWLNEIDNELGQIESELSSIDNELGQIEGELRSIKSVLNSMNQFGIRTY